MRAPHAHLPCMPPTTPRHALALGLQRHDGSRARICECCVRSGAHARVASMHHVIHVGQPGTFTYCAPGPAACQQRAAATSIPPFTLSMKGFAACTERLVDPVGQPPGLWRCHPEGYTHTATLTGRCNHQAAFGGSDVPAAVTIRRL